MSFWLSFQKLKRFANASSSSAQLHPGSQYCDHWNWICSKFSATEKVQNAENQCKFFLAGYFMNAKEKISLLSETAFWHFDSCCVFILRWFSLCSNLKRELLPVSAQLHSEKNPRNAENEKWLLPAYKYFFLVVKTWEKHYFANISDYLRMQQHHHNLNCKWIHRMFLGWIRKAKLAYSCAPPCWNKLFFRKRRWT